MADAIVIRSANTNNITLLEAEEIAGAVRRLNPSWEVKVTGREVDDYGVTWFEVLRISLLAGAFEGAKQVGAGKLANQLAEIVVDWARERFRGRRRMSKRPVSVAIFGANGIVKSVVIKNATDEPEDRTAQDQRMAKAANSEK